MEFFLGFLVTVITLYVFSRVYKRNSDARQPIKIRSGQSQKFEITKYSYFPLYQPVRSRQAQSYKYQDRTMTKVLVLENKAYWIQPNGLHTANVINGVLDQESTKIVDTMAMDDVELKQIIYVIDQLSEGKPDDTGNSRN